MIDGPRACRPKEFEETITLINATFRAGSDQNIRTDYPLIFNLDQLDNMRIVKVGGKVVAHVPVAPRQVIAGEDRFTVGIISPTVTDPDHRHKGYATLCLRDNVGRMQENDWPVSVLWIEHATFPFYHHSGWEAVGNQGWMYTLRPEDHALFAPDDCEAVPLQPDHLEAVIRFHDAERHRIARSREEYAALLALPKVETLVALADSSVAGYICVGSGSNKPGIIEAGGHPSAVESLIGHVLRNRNEPIQAITNLTPSALDDLLSHRAVNARQAVEEAAGLGPQMMRINNLGLLLRRIRNHLSARSQGLNGKVTLHCPDTGETETVTVDDGRVEFDDVPAQDPIRLSQRQLVQLIFGPHPTHEPVPLPDTAAGVLLDRFFPFYFPVWELDHS